MTTSNTCGSTCIERSSKYIKGSNQAPNATNSACLSKLIISQNIEYGNTGTEKKKKKCKFSRITRYAQIPDQAPNPSNRQSVPISRSRCKQHIITEIFPQKAISKPKAIPKHGKQYPITTNDLNPQNQASDTTPSSPSYHESD